MMKVIVVFKRLLASGNDQHGRHLFKWGGGGNRWNILGFNFTKRDALSGVYKIYMVFCSSSNCVDFSLVVSVHANEVKVRYGMARLELHGRSRSQEHFNCKILKQHQLPVKVGRGIHA
jgi:hypothetical protein